MTNEFPTLEELQETGAKKADIVSLIHQAQDLIGDAKHAPSTMLRERKDDLLTFYSDLREVVMDLSDDAAVQKGGGLITRIIGDVLDGGTFNWKTVGAFVLLVATIVLTFLLL